MDQRRWQKKAHTNWACRFARSDEQGGLGQIHVDSGRTHRPPTRRGWLDPQAAAGPRGPAKSRRRANWLPAGHHPPGPMPPAPGVEQAPARGYAVPGSGHPQAVDGRMSVRVAQFASNPAPRTSTRFAALAVLIHRRAAAPGGSGWGVSRRGPRYIFFTHRPPTQHPEDHRPSVRLSMAASAWHIARNAARPPRRPKASAKNARRRPCQAGDP